MGRPQAVLFILTIYILYMYQSFYDCVYMFDYKCFVLLLFRYLGEKISVLKGDYLGKTALLRGENFGIKGKEFLFYSPKLLSLLKRI